MVEIKKQNKVTLVASKRNCNRVKFGTRQLEAVLKLEGYELAIDERVIVQQNRVDYDGRLLETPTRRVVRQVTGVIMGEQVIPLNRIELTPRRKHEPRPQTAPVKATEPTTKTDESAA